MRHINTCQIDNHCWKFSVTDGYSVFWTAMLDGSKLTMYNGEKTYGNPSGKATIKGIDESDTVGKAMTLVFNWSQQGPSANEKLSHNWTVIS